MTQSTPSPAKHVRLSGTSLSQPVRLKNRDRFLRFRLRRDEKKAFLKKWRLTFQPLMTLLKDFVPSSNRMWRTVIASQVVVNLLTSDLEIFDNAVIWKRLYYQYAARLL